MPGERNLYLAPPFLVSDYEPLALKAYRSGLLKERVEMAREELKACNMCPRFCGVDRMQNKMGACNTGRYAVVSSAFPHFGEESVLQGWNGSGTIFFGLCNLRCVFCQNWDISQKKQGWELKPEEIADLMLKLQNETKCHNINFVTPEHVVPQVIEAIYSAVEQGLNLPIVYNTSSYDSVKSLQLLDGIVDIYMPDFKFWTPETSQRLCKAKDYPDVTKAVIKEMYRQVGDLVFDHNGLAKRGLLVRHLVMPGLVHEGKDIMQYLADEISKDTYINIMEQYRPTFKVGKGEMRAREGFTKYEDIDRPIHSKEYEELQYFAYEIGLWRHENYEPLDKPFFEL
eukprot:TRINITY_DN24471_c0_g1_i1.p1 TRINITY_DN24471_c0_g1~~TRINITY_DN24471_c0_g1_i1.p1  ORF type:complete len:341 (-),score=45.24 TRINITY_DN24471_c0_g1_i1:147-1169(-)